MARTGKRRAGLLLLLGCMVVPAAFAADFPSETAAEHLQDNSVAHTASLATPDRNKPVVLVGKTASAALGHVANTVTVPASDLPELGSAWRHAGAVVIEGNELAELDKAQLQSLLDYIGNCGRGLFINLPLATEQTLRQRAACAGNALRFVHAGPADSARLVAALDGLFEFDVTRLPNEAALSRLASPGRNGIAYVSTLLGGFTLLFVVLAAFPATRLTALLACPLAVALIFLTGGDRQYGATVAWAEAQGGERIARFVAQQSLNAARRGIQELRPSSLASSPARIVGHNIEVNWNAVAVERSLRWQATMFQPMNIQSSGSFPVTNLLRAQVTDGLPVVCNRGTLASPEAYLHWQGHHYRVPPLAPAQQWTASAVDALRSPTPELRLLAARTGTGVAAVMYPVASAPDSTHVWLARFENKPQVPAPCAG